jgi:hypothetical protein
MIRKINADADAVDINLLEDLVTFAQIHLVSKVSVLVSTINEAIIDRMCCFMLSTYPPILMFNQLNISSMVKLPSKIRKAIVKRITQHSPQLDLKEQIDQLHQELKELKSKEKSDEFETDKEYLIQAIISILKEGTKLQVLAEHKVESLIDLPLVEASITKGKSTHAGKDDRIKERVSSRMFLSGREQENLKNFIEGKLMQYIDNTTQLQKATSDVGHAEHNTEEHFNNKKLLGWLNIDKFLLRTDVSLKKLFSTYIKEIFEHMIKLEKFEFSILKEFCPDNSKAKDNRSSDSHFLLSSHDPKINNSIGLVKFSEEAFKDIFSFSYTAFKHTVISIAALFFILDHYSFLYTQTNTFVKDLISTSIIHGNEVENLKSALIEEVENLESDEENILALADVMDLGIIRIDLQTFKASVRNQIDENRKVIRKALQADMKIQVKHLEEGIETVFKLCSTIPSTIDEYIKVKATLESEDFQNKLDKLERDSGIFDVEIDVMNKLKEIYDHNLLLKKLFLNTMLKDCFEHHKDFSESFKKARLNFYDEISLHRVELMNDFKAV